MRKFLHRTLTLLLALTLGLAPVTVQAQNQNHTVQAGENLFRIGLRYGVTVDALMRANGLTSIYIYVGQVLVIPSQNTPVAQPTAAPPAPANTAAPSGPVYHIVQRGETLFTIGLRYNLPWTRIAEANGLVSDRIDAGQQLVIPVPGVPIPTTQPTAVPSTAAPTETPAATAVPATEVPATPAPATTEIIHTVQSGETLFTIGLKYSLQWTTIMSYNNLGGDLIYVGQQLKIPTDPNTIAQAAANVPAPQTGGSKAPIPGRTGKYFLVDISDQMIYAFEGETLMRYTLVSTGRWPTPTVLGTYQIYVKYVSTRMVGPGYDLPNVPYTMYFYKGYGIHGTYWHSNFGTPMSHGCVNLPTPEAEWAFNWASVGTTVIVQQ